MFILYNLAIHFNIYKRAFFLNPQEQFLNDYQQIFSELFLSNQFDKEKQKTSLNIFFMKK